MMSAVAMERIRRSLLGLAAVELAAHIMALLGQFVFNRYMFGLSLIYYPIGKAIVESIGIASTVVLGIGAWLKHDMVIFSYMIIGAIYLIAHLICSAYMLKYMLRFLGLNLGQMQGFIYPTIATFLLLLLNVGTAIFYIVQDTEVPITEEDPNSFPLPSDEQRQPDNLEEQPSTSAAAIAAAAQEAV